MGNCGSGLVGVVCAVLAVATSSFAQSLPPDSEPQPLQLVEPTIPPDAIPSGLAATVQLDLTIDASGHVTNATVTRSAGTALDDAVVAAARASTFTPALRGGVPTATTIPYRYRFARQADVPAPPAPAPVAHLHGLVRDTHERDVRHAVLMFGDDGVMHVLDEGEHFSFDIEAPRHLVMYVFAPGYRTLHAERDVRADDDVYIVFHLAPVGESHAGPSRADLTIRGHFRP